LIPSPSSEDESESPTDDEAAGWDITMQSATGGRTDDGNPTITIRYESSNRDYKLNLYEADCKTTTNVLDFKDGVVEGSPKKGFMYVEGTVTVGDQHALEDSPLWNDGTNGFSFCLSKSLFTKDVTENVDMIVTQRKNKFRVTMDNEADFEINGISVEQDNIEEQAIGISYKGRVRGFVCDAATFAEKTQTEPLGPFDRLDVCVEIDNSDESDVDVVVQSISDMELLQIGGAEFTALEDGNIRDGFDDLVHTECNNKGVCMVRTQLINAFFSTATVLTVKGKAVLGSGGSGKVPKLTLEGNERLQYGNGEFNLKVELAEPCKEGEGKKFLRNFGII
jgi:hypothetical protein